jgi:hypothetical protein
VAAWPCCNLRQLGRRKPNPLRGTRHLRISQSSTAGNLPSSPVAKSQVGPGRLPPSAELGLLACASLMSDGSQHRAAYVSLTLF